MNVKKMTNIAMIAAVYTVLCLIPGLSAIAFGQVQIRIAEALTMLPLIYQPSIYGVTLGCFLSNLIGAMTGVNPTGYLDAAVGTVATLLAAICTYALRNKRIKGIPVASIAMPVIFNFFFVGFELGMLFMPDDPVRGMIINGTYVAVGETIAVILGYLLVRALKNSKVFDR